MHDCLRTISHKDNNLAAVRSILISEALAPVASMVKFMPIKKTFVCEYVSVGA